MCTMLCLSATYLSILRLGNPSQARAALHLLAKSAQLFREMLSGLITLQNCDALMETSLLMQYILWCDLSVLEQRLRLRALDISNDQLFLLGSGVQHIFPKSLPLFVRTRSVFLLVAVERPRVRIEEAAC